MPTLAQSTFAGGFFITTSTDSHTSRFSSKASIPAIAAANSAKSNVSKAKRDYFCRTDNPAVWHVGTSVVLHGALLDRGFELGVGDGGHGDEEVVCLLQDF